uniref:Uncharacterized protein n=1 Tax=Candidatus Berkiella cookevillensis TaxID=437022 RepID=A0A0Q9YER4_9GAMM
MHKYFKKKRCGCEKRRVGKAKRIFTFQSKYRTASISKSHTHAIDFKLSDYLELVDYTGRVMQQALFQSI